jgi:hypothetical protein
MIAKISVFGIPIQVGEKSGLRPSGPDLGIGYLVVTRIQDK